MDVRSSISRLRAFINSPAFQRGAIIVTISFIATAGVMAMRRGADLEQRASESRLRLIRRAGPQLVLIYIGSARCAWCRNPSLPGLLRTVQDTLDARARKFGFHFTSVGVSVDILKDEGLAHLNKLADFDQVAAGGSWMNELMIDYVWNQYGAPSSTPQLLVVSRRLVRNEGGGMVTMQTVEQRLVARKAGLRAIEAWVRDGVAIPRLR